MHISTARRVSVGPPQNCLISWRIWFVLLSRTDPRPMDASPPRLDHSIVFARWCQFARGSTRVVLPRRDLDRFIRFCRAYGRDQQADRPRYCVCSNRPLSRACGPVWARRRCRISPPRFLTECCKRQLNQGSLVLLYFRLSAFSDLY